jgi:FAD-dependent oxidoreductase domain-containing protein 1
VDLATRQAVAHKSRKFDVVIVGGGIMGSSTAYWLASNPDFSGNIAVIEKDPTYAFSTTARSNSCIRLQFSTALNIEISKFGVQFLQQLPKYLTVGDEGPDISFRECGYLFLATTPEGRDKLLQNHATQRRHGITDVAALTPEALAVRFPWMNTEGVTGATLGLKYEGAFDPYSLLHAFKKKARSLGVTYLAEEVVGLRHTGTRVSEVVTRNGPVECETVVNAAGAWARGVAAMANIDLPVFPRPRFVFAFTCPVAIPDLPLLIDPDGFYVRPDGPNFICGMKPPDDQDRNSHDFDVDYCWFDDELWPRLARWVPAFESVKMRHAWTGHYEYNTFDRNALMGAHPSIGNLLFCNGFSGHGMQQSPAAGRGISELIVYGEYRTLDLSAFSIQRLVDNRPIIEQYVV